MTGLASTVASGLPGATSPPSTPSAVRSEEYVIIRLGPWPVPLTDQQRGCLDRLIARARIRQLPFLSILDDQRRECVAFVVEPLPTVAVVATGVTP
ncbi:MAG: hypothetical protein ABS52_04225 [Gemmatimonadetes bacterium SCN 70-22]|nr:MAG: hypothetical protein ABS52_04225 [Gemmatimonadetes bacterium SCN 70-22]